MIYKKRVLQVLLCSVFALLAACGGSDSTLINNATPPDLGAANEAANPADNVDAFEQNLTEVTNTTDIAVPAQFDWSSNGEISLQVSLHDSSGMLAPNTGLIVYSMPDAAAMNGDREPTDQELQDVAKLFSGVSDSNGQVIATLQAPGHVIDKGRIFVKTKLMGVVGTAVVPLSQSENGSMQAAWVFGPPGIETDTVDEFDPDFLDDGVDQSLVSSNATTGNYYLQPFGSYYHSYYGHMPQVRRGGNCDITTATAGQMCRSAVDNAEITRLAEIVQEGNTPQSKYLDAEASQSNLVFSKKANVIVTFLQEGAGYQNTFGFFTYNTSAEPTDHLNVDSAKVLFPNTSFRGSGGYLNSGDSVSLGEFDPALGHNAMGFWLAANGWQHNRGMGKEGHHFYTLESLNPEPDATDRKHMLLIANEVDETTNTRRLWVAVEDIRLDQGADRDYNDLIMQLDVYPADALVFADQIPDVTDEDNTVKDADNDGVLAGDDLDDNDPQRAFERYYPGEKTWGTLLAEDNWPALGDFDMNDMVVRYRTREVLDSNKNIKDVHIQYRLEARGAAFHNGFAVSLGDAVFSDNVELAELNGEALQPMPDATSLAYEIFSDAWTYTYEGGEQCWTYNTMSDCPNLASNEFTLKLSFANAVEQTNIAKPPYNPFLFAHKIDADVSGYTRINALNNELYAEDGLVRDIEIHLPYKRPTQGQDVTLFGTGDDASDGVERFYVSGENLPWIIDIPDAILYPEEFSDISKAYPLFASWVESGGTNFRDWYRQPADDESLIYNKEDTLTLGASAYDFDFGTESSAVRDGWTRISPNTENSLASWSGDPIDSRDRGTGGGVNDINQDLVFGSGTSTLNLNIGNGVWAVTMNMGDTCCHHDEMSVIMEGETIDSNITATKGQFVYVARGSSTSSPASFKVQVDDGQLTIELSDQGGSDVNWVLNRLSLQRLD